MNFSKAEVKKKEDVPAPRGKQIDYEPLYRKVATIAKDEALQVPIEKDHQTTNIQNALDRGFEHSKYKAFTRTIDGQKYCFVTQVK